MEANQHTQMEANYPVLRRPKRKLCYLTNKETTSKQWAGALSLGDVDRMFDDLDSVSHVELLPQTLLLEESDTDTKHEREASLLQNEPLTEKQTTSQKVPKVVLCPVIRSPSPEMNIDLDIPFQRHGPVKTSSPIEENMGVEGAQEESNEKDQMVSPILFTCEDDAQEEAKTEPLPIQKQQSNGYNTEKSSNSELESPPNKVVLSKPQSSHKNKIETSSSRNCPPGSEKTPMKSQTPFSEGPRNLLQSGHEEPKQPVPEKKSEIVNWKTAVTNNSRKEMTVFLQRLRDAGQPKPAVSKKLVSPVKPPTPPPETEDDFLILENDTPLWFSIPTKTRQKNRNTSSSDKDSSTEKGMKGSVPEVAQKQLEADQEKEQHGCQGQVLKQKMISREEMEIGVTGAAGVEDENIIPSPDDPPAVEFPEPDKLNRKKRHKLKRPPSKESDTAEDGSKDTASRGTDDETSQKAPKPPEVKVSKSSEHEKENAKMSRARSGKKTVKGKQGSDGVKEMASVTDVKEQRKESSEDHADVEDLGSLSDKELGKSEAHTAKRIANRRAKQVQQSLCSEEDQVLGKRKRNPPGQWWLSCPQSTEEAEVRDKQPIVKKSKQNHKVVKAAKASPEMAQKDKVSKRRIQHKTTHNMNKVKKMKTKLNTYKTTKGKTDEMKAAIEGVVTAQAEQFEDQELLQEVLDQDPDAVYSSPVVFPQREQSINSGDHIFQRVYHHSGNKKMTSTPVSPGGSSEQLITTKQRRRRRPGDWWKVDYMSEEVEIISPQCRPMEAKLQKQRRTQAKQTRSPEHWNPDRRDAVVSSTPVRGAPVPPLKQVPLCPPKTVKSSLSTFRNIFTSTMESPRVLSSRDAVQDTVTVCPAEDSAPAAARPSRTNKNTASIGAGESSPESPQDGKRPSKNTLTVLRSGPSMIELEEYEDTDLPSSRVIQTGLSVSDLCAPPLKPLMLQAKDKANLTEWLKSLWPTTVNNGGEITPDHFDWYFYQGRAIGILEDLHWESICNGKMLLGSFMKKPLWVDHSATTVFNLLTSSVSVNIDCTESRFNPGQSFMVPFGHAYSIQNLSAQPAVLYFTRIQAESQN